MPFCSIDPERLDEIHRLIVESNLGYFSDTIRAMRQLFEEVTRMSAEGEVLEELVAGLTTERDELHRALKMRPKAPEAAADDDTMGRTPRVRDVDQDCVGAIGLVHDRPEETLRGTR